MDVVVPAHNEEAGISACLDRLAESTAVGKVVVVANGCADRTAEVARAHSSAPDVVVLGTAGKAAALNAGDARCTGFPRAYLDADVELGGRALDALAAAAARPEFEAAVPAARIDLTGASWAVRRYYAVWQRLPAVHRSSAGRGVYVLDARAHDRLFPLPGDLISDDGHVSASIERRVVVPEAVVTVRAPRDLGSLVRRRQRVHSGNARLVRAAGPPTGVRTVVGLLRDRQAYMADVAVFLAVTIAARAMANLRRGPIDWGTDHSSRG
ncbi:glycosyltransferase [Actinokineospora auranticolor]|uniref:4,4'-diaponeurosporenoate glycosyltransferase n=1 Tax=Actinokineospora auranticolor TaxID=155976 RepID=A0A2S6GCJ2_9PSEU|nr:glycosyltransferase [Actinokineospora auranticolor]PPK62568.1 glycosyl transferase family 2 [Actinokineospora auranticolor]